MFIYTYIFMGVYIKCEVDEILSFNDNYNYLQFQTILLQTIASFEIYIYILCLFTK